MELDIFLVEVQYQDDQQLKLLKSESKLGILKQTHGELVWK